MMVDGVFLSKSCPKRCCPVIYHGDYCAGWLLKTLLSTDFASNATLT